MKKGQKAQRDKEFNGFKRKETRLNAAIDRVKAKLAEYAAYGEKVHAACVAESRNWTEADHAPVKDWNQLHDLQYRLEDRLWDNHSAYQDWHWTVAGFNVYNF